MTDDFMDMDKDLSAEEALSNIRGLISIAGEEAVEVMRPVSERLVLILNGVHSIEDSKQEAQKEDVQAVLNEFILLAYHLPHAHLVGALYYAMPALIKELIRSEAERGD